MPIGKLTQLVLVMVFSGCGLFEPREVSAPNTFGTRDALNLGAISQTARITRQKYSEILHPEVLYINESTGDVYRYSEMVARLNTITETYTGIEVSWQGAEQVPVDGTVELVRDYVVVADQRYSGTAEFVLVDSDGTWQILQWSDAAQQSPVSFFSPGFEVSQQ